MAATSSSSDTRLSGPTWKYVAKRSIAEFGRDGGTDQAAKLTYFTVLAIAPTLLALFSLAALLLKDIKDQIAGLVKNAVASTAGGSSDAIGPAVESTLDSLMGSTTGGTVALIIGIATAMWSASAYVKAFGRVSNEIYEIKEGRGPIRLNGAMLALTVVLILGLLLIMVSLLLSPAIVEGLLAPIAGPMGMSGAVAFLSQSFLPIWTWVKWPVILVIAFALVSLLYWGAPNLSRKFRLISPGGVFAIVGIAIAAVALSVYMSTVASYSSYGAIGGIMAILFALWVMNIVIILGAEVDAEFERAKELEAGRPAEDSLTQPLRGEAGVEKAKEKRAELVDEARDIRLRNLHNDAESYKEDPFSGRTEKSSEESAAGDGDAAGKGDAAGGDAPSRG